MLAAWACMAVYYLRGRTGLPFLSVIAALQCIQPTKESMRQMGKKRVIGTLVGAVWGAVVLYLEFLAAGDAGIEEMLHFALMGGCAGLVIYSTVLLHIQDNAYYAAVVFLSIAMNHVTDANPAVYIIDRVIDTGVGVLIGTVINSLHLPRTRDFTTLFLSGVDQMVSHTEHRLAPYTKVELNRLIEDGAKFTVITRQTPALIREVLAGVKLKYPVIAMDGAVMYDMSGSRFLKTVKMDPEICCSLNQFLCNEEAHYFVNTVRDDLLVIYYPKMYEGAMKNLYLKKRSSPYRNYVRSEQEINDDVIYFHVIDEEQKIRDLEKQLLAQPFAALVRTSLDDYLCEEGDLILRIYAKEASRKKMLEQLKEMTGTGTVIKYGTQEEGADLVSFYVGDRMVKDIKSRFEKVDLRGWRNILHF